MNETAITPRFGGTKYICAISMLALIAIMCLLFWNPAVFDFCDTAIYRTVPSPNNTMALVIFGRDCGATTAFNTQISLVPKNAKFSPSAFPSFLSMKGRHDLAPYWITNRQVEIHVPNGERIYREEQSVDGVKIVYK